MEELIDFLLELDDDHTRAVIRSRLLHWLAYADSAPMSAALGIQTPKQARRQLRNAFCRKAARHLGTTPKERAEELTARVKAFERRWPRVRGEHAPPENLDDVEKLLFSARRLGRLPTSIRHWLRVVT